ncbi:MAG: ImmA/IrrE family metallo-endopeptidase [Streptosporangiaceae bacterium]
MGCSASISEREADAFAAEFLTPTARIVPALPAHADFTKLARLQQTWGVSVGALLYRCRELGLLSGPAATRAWRRLNALRGAGAFAPEPVGNYPGEQPVLLTRAFDIATQHGLSLHELAHRLAWPTSLLSQLLDHSERRPALTVVP